MHSVLQCFVKDTFLTTYSASRLCIELGWYIKYIAVETARSGSSSYFSDHQFCIKSYIFGRWTGEPPKSLKLCHPENNSEPGWQRIWPSNAGLREVAKGLLLDSHLSCGREITKAHKLFSNDFPPLACLNRSHIEHMYSNFDSRLTNDMSIIDQPRCTSMVTHCGYGETKTQRLDFIRRVQFPGGSYAQS